MVHTGQVFQPQLSHSSFIKTESHVALTLLSRSNNSKWKSDGIKIYFILELFIFAFSNGLEDCPTGH